MLNSSHAKTSANLFKHGTTYRLPQHVNYTFTFVNVHIIEHSFYYETGFTNLYTSLGVLCSISIIQRVLGLKMVNTVLIVF